MKLFTVSTWLKSPLDRDVIRRWTVGADKGMTYRLELPPPPDPDRFSFLALGDTGDSEASGPHTSPQDAVAREMARDAALPGSPGSAQFVLHTGDVIYMTGEKRLYERSFRRPYADFLCPESTIDNLVFRQPFLPVPGNHDYYDLGGWLHWLMRVPILNAGVRAIAHDLFAFSLPEGGSDGGAAYMNVFVNPDADTRETPLPYVPGSHTRLPNRYYQFTCGSVDFFALDSNTLDAPAPWADGDQVREDAAARIARLDKAADELDTKLRVEQRRLDAWRKEAHADLTRDHADRDEAGRYAQALEQSLEALNAALTSLTAPPQPFRDANGPVSLALNRWKEAGADWQAAGADLERRVAALEALSAASDDVCAALRALDGCLGALPEAAEHAALLALRTDIERALSDWARRVDPTPTDLARAIRTLSEEALDVQRDLAQAKRRLRYRPEDHDGAQLQWLERALTESVEQRPGHWRVVFFHHPLYTTIKNHAEETGVVAIRELLQPRLKDRVHVVLTGHSHAFEWFAADTLPNAGLFVSGGGGQVSLRPSILSPSRIARYQDRYDSLRRAGVTQCASAGYGPDAPDGEDGPLYHYVAFEVTPDVLRARPVGVRRVETGFRREEPMSVWHTPELPAARPPFRPRRLRLVEIRRDAPPVPVWEDG